MRCFQVDSTLLSSQPELSRSPWTQLLTTVLRMHSFDPVRALSFSFIPIPAVLHFPFLMAGWCFHPFTVKWPSFFPNPKFVIKTKVHMSLKIWQRAIGSLDIHVNTGFIVQLKHINQIIFRMARYQNDGKVYPPQNNNQLKKTESKYPTTLG